MPYRNNEREPFDPQTHEPAVNGSYVRKTAVESGRQADIEALFRNNERSWFKKLFNWGIIKGMDVLHEEALKEHVGQLYFFKPDITMVSFSRIQGTFNGVKIVLTHSGNDSTVDGHLLGKKEAQLLYKMLRPLVAKEVRSVEEGKKRRQTRGTAEARQAVSKLLGPRRTESALDTSSPPRQLEAHEDGDDKKE